MVYFLWFQNVASLILLAELGHWFWSTIFSNNFNLQNKNGLPPVVKAGPFSIKILTLENFLFLKIIYQILTTNGKLKRFDIEKNMNLKRLSYFPVKVFGQRSHIVTDRYLTVTGCFYQPWPYIPVPGRYWTFFTVT